MVRIVLRVCALAGAFVLSCAALASLSGCGTGLAANVDPDQVDAVTPPAVGDCRVLIPADVHHPSNAVRTVSCSKPHTAETYAVGTLPAALDDAAYDSRDVAREIYQDCTTAFATHLGADESVAMRTVLSWAEFQPSEKAWKKGARWYRCDLVGADDAASKKTRFPDLPTSTRNLLRGSKPPDRWMICARGTSIDTSTKVPCTKKHDWRAATTIKVGDPDEAYPGDRAIEVKTREYCHSSISAWLNYALDFQYAYTWFHEAEWEAGIRRSICWARTDA